MSDTIVPFLLRVVDEVEAERDRARDLAARLKHELAVETSALEAACFTGREQGFPTSATFRAHAARRIAKLQS